MPAAHTPRSTRPGTPDKRAIDLNLSIDGMEAAWQLDINISQVCDSHLREIDRQALERKWREEHAVFISAHNAIIKSEGLPLDEWKSF
ncbi:MAG: type II toxin-antitoxin system CcdA family antitoxin [Burkholderiaceae bacterium]